MKVNEFGYDVSSNKDGGASICAWPIEIMRAIVVFEIDVEVEQCFLQDDYIIPIFS